MIRYIITPEAETELLKVKGGNHAWFFDDIVKKNLTTRGYLLDARHDGLDFEAAWKIIRKLSYIHGDGEVITFGGGFSNGSSSSGNSESSNSSDVKTEVITKTEKVTLGGVDCFRDFRETDVAAIRETILVKIANNLGIEASTRDRKSDTVKKIYDYLVKNNVTK